MAEASPFSLTSAAVETALRTGDQAGLLEDYFGATHYAELRRLAQQAAVRSVRGGACVLILPGIMGSTLGLRRGDDDDVIWVDVLDVIRGRLRALSLADGDASVRALGVILFAYLGFKLRLRIAGHDASFHPYDWRLSLPTLGAELAARIKRESRPVHLAAHSMGGLVARAALAGGAPGNLKRIVMLGTPNYGSFSPIQAFRGAHSIVRKVDFLDVRHSRDELARDVFGTFPGLHEMIPSPEKAGVDYFDLAAWPSGGVLPDAGRLAAAKAVQAKLPAEHPEIVLIAGVEQETVVSARVVGDEFEYQVSNAGDGTVPLAFAQLPSAKTYYVEEEHGALPSNETVAAAVDNILMTGATKLLPDRWTPRRAATLRSLREGQLERAPVYEGAPGRALSQREQRQLLAEFASPGRPSLAPMDAPPPAAAPEAGPPHRIDRVVIGRRRQHRLDITVAHGSITEVQASAYVLGLFRQVTPGGAAQAVDAQLQGAIGDFVSRRMFGGNVGEITVLPTGRHLIRADLVVFAGLGAFDSFREEVLEVVAENVARTFLMTGIADFATVPFGGNTGVLSSAALRHFIKGLFRGLKDVDRDHRFRGVTICETDGERFRALRDALFRLSATELFDEVEVTLTERELPPPLAPAARSLLASRAPIVYLMIRQENDAGSPDRLSFGVSVMTSGAKAAIYRGRKEVSAAELSAHLKRIETAAFTHSSLPAFGEKLADLVLPPEVRTILSRNSGSHLAIVHDAGSSRIPWETIRFDGDFPALSGGLSHRYEAENLSVAKFLEQRQHGAALDVLLVVNPTEDLEGAEQEGKRIENLFGEQGSSVRLRILRGPEARKSELMDCFSSGEFDVVHYAGHAFFDAERPSRSGILCHGGEVLSGADLAGLGNLPSLVFFNACEAGRIRRTAEERANPRLAIEQRAQATTSFAEAFMRGGVANYLGTYWPVGDSSATRFAEVFYASLLRGESIGRAILAGRAAIDGIASVDWADYVLYGDAEFVLKLPA